MLYSPPYVEGDVPAVPGIHNADANASYFNGDAAAGIEGSFVPGEAIEAPQRELIKLIVSAGITPSSSVLDQVAEATVRLASKGVTGIGSGTASAHIVTALAGVVAPRALFDGLTLIYEAPATNAGGVTVNPFELGVTPIVTWGNAVLPDGSMEAGRLTVVRYKAALSKFVLLPWASAALGAATTVSVPVTVGITGASRGLLILATGASALITLTADEVMVRKADGSFARVAALNLTCNTATVGANGLDAGVLAASTWYAEHVIWNETTSTAALLISLSATAPTLPAGYTHSALVGWMRTDGTANKYPLAFRQAGNRFDYVVAAGTNVATGRICASGASGIVGPPSDNELGNWRQIGLSSFVPPAARRVHGSVSGAGGYNIGVAPSNAYGPVNASTTNAPPAQSASTTTVTSIPFEFPLLAPTPEIYWSNNGGGQVYIGGFTL